MISNCLKASLFALALGIGLTATAQDTPAPTTAATAATETTETTEATEAAVAPEAAPAAEAAAAPATAPAAEAAPAPAAAPTAEATAEATPAAAPAAASDEAAPATGRIVFFRPRKMVGGAISFKVREGDAVLGKLSSGSFFSVDVPAGTHSYYAKSEGKDDTLVMEIEAGETYYVMGTISMGFLAGQGNLSPSDQAAFDDLNKKKKLKDRTGEAVD